MGNKYIQLLIIIFLLSALYRFMPEGEAMILWAYFIMLAGLYYGKYIKESVIVGSVLASFFMLQYSGGHLIIYILSITLFLSVIPIPFYFFTKTEKEKKKLSSEIAVLKEKYTDMLIEQLYSAEERQKYENDIKRIMQLYLIGKELSKNVYPHDFTASVIKLLSSRDGVVGVNIFLREKGKWVPAAFSKIYHKNDWIKYVGGNGELENKTNCSLIDKPDFLERNESVIYLPLKIEEEFLGCILLVVEKTYASRYLEESLIICSQISLSAKRVNLFSEVRERSRNDGLTGLYLKRYFMERLDSEMRREKRYSNGFYIFMMDIDFFKKVNDKYGHIAGDKVLCAVAKILVDCMRPGDLIGRYGGEEFIAFMPMASKEEALEAAEKINKTVENKKFYENNESFNITISIGISKYPGDGKTVDEIISAADKALYTAKKEGRNKVVLCADKNGQ